jgi:hypothetical protein
MQRRFLQGSSPALAALQVFPAPAVPLLRANSEQQADAHIQAAVVGHHIPPFSYLEAAVVGVVVVAEVVDRSPQVVAGMSQGGPQFEVDCG